MAHTDVVASNRGWFLTLGIVLLVVGVFSVLFPFILTLTAEILVGIGLTAGGLALLFHSFSERNWSGFFWELLMGVLYLVGGLYFLFNPLGGIIAFTMALAAIFIVDGVFRILLGLKARPHSGAIWLIFGGVVSIVLGGMIWANLPGSAIWAIGMLLGINLAFAGASFIALGTSAYAPK
ncbi:uncharacterized membrane protein HdeD (DUF308 family) [Rhodoligotrophos appendicifer]|uniref:HdeD family acid-resistance protein n=1 Tax=Rhodoligotrophos appendicifer TaxID=987056 RepID=UPI001478437A|nr:HdeD family acid-resistance protein [Rhodoligotrophos appendicifer]